MVIKCKCGEDIPLNVCADVRFMQGKCEKCGKKVVIDKEYWEKFYEEE